MKRIYTKKRHIYGENKYIEKTYSQKEYIVIQDKQKR